MDFVRGDHSTKVVGRLSLGGAAGGRADSTEQSHTRHVRWGREETSPGAAPGLVVEVGTTDEGTALLAGRLGQGLEGERVAQRDGVEGAEVGE